MTSGDSSACERGADGDYSSCSLAYVDNIGTHRAYGRPYALCVRGRVYHASADHATVAALPCGLTTWRSCNQGGRYLWKYSYLSLKPGAWDVIVRENGIAWLHIRRHHRHLCKRPDHLCQVTPQGITLRGERLDWELKPAARLRDHSADGVRPRRRDDLVGSTATQQISIELMSELLVLESIRDELAHSLCG